MFISLSVLVSVTQFRCQPVQHTHRCVLLLHVLGHGCDLCMSCTTSDTHRLRYRYHRDCSISTSVSGLTCVLYKAYTANTITSSSAHILSHGGSASPSYQGPLSQGGGVLNTLTFNSTYSYIHVFRVSFPKYKMLFFWYSLQMSKIFLALFVG